MKAKYSPHLLRILLKMKDLRYSYFVQYHALKSLLRYMDAHTQLYTSLLLNFLFRSTPS